MKRSYRLKIKLKTLFIKRISSPPLYYYGSAEGHEYPDLYRLSDNYR